jgi:D-alanyl-D-alanine carboxypeptidase
MIKKVELFFIIGSILISCEKVHSSGKTPKTEDELPAVSAVQQVSGDEESLFKLEKALRKAEIPKDGAEKIVKAAKAGVFFADLDEVMRGDPSLRFLVDKKHPLPDNYEPPDLLELKNGAYRVGKSGMLLRRVAAESLENMAKSAQAEGVTVLVSSTYRSYQYQVTVYNRNVREMGQEAADRESARPGNSQHQTGLVVDFGSIDDSFAQTKAGKWMLANAGKFGWSLSFPDGYENITGYRWESWHYRYVGVALARFIELYFNGIQQYALQFLYEWEKNGEN